MNVLETRAALRRGASSNGMVLLPGFELPLARLLMLADRWRDLDRDRTLPQADRNGA
jgi:hypothetical protein